ncbi:hypothetical protein [Streptomyces sp. NBC_00620]|uniref:hypothetical protein n=1 Tax=Streptomyces sp. NBC_00620 TaxID=2903666 RepID=UPI00225593F1|nr:hypothetical protein [Streptomyces sp. NBC_00620]MCX4974213.1 hypothetical protein [Streptomyces sp. NBC_00620]
MIVVYTPKGGEPQHYDASTLKVSEASIVQRTVDMKWQAILAGLGEDDLDAMRGIIWVIRKRTEPSLRWGDFDPGVLEMTSRMDDGEMERWITAFVAASDSDLEWETIHKIIDSRIDDVAADPEHARVLLAAQAPSPKAEAPEQGSEPETAAEPETGEDPSPSPTSSEPETPTSVSSGTSSTSRRRRSTTSASATSTT